MLINVMAPIVKLITSQTNRIKTVIDTLNCLISDCNITFYPNMMGNKVGGVAIKELNKTQSILIHCKLDANQFDSYEFSYSKEKITIGINLSNLLCCLKCMNNLDSMTWIIDDDDINKLIMILEHKKERKKFSINLMDLDFNDYDIETVDFPFKASLPTHDFQRYCKDMNSGSDKMDIKCTGDNLIFSCSGDSGDYEFIVNQCTEGVIITKDENIDEEIVQGLFELKYLTIFTRCTSLSERVTLFLKNNYPLVIQYPVASLGLLKLVLSPSKPSNLY